MKTNPHLKRIDTLPRCSVAIEQPLVMLLEAGPGFSAIIARHVSAEPDDGAIRLEECTHFRIDPQGTCRTRHDDRIEVLWDPAIRHWIASPDQFVSVFSQPSLDPYAVIHLSKLTVSAIESALQQHDHEAVFMMMRVRFAELPAFYSPGPGTLQTGPNYASGRNVIAGRYRLIE